jgi:ribosome-binding factor A
MSFFAGTETGKMKPYTRSERVAGLIRQVLAELLYKNIKDPRLTSATVTGVKVSRDLRIAKIYYTTSGDAGLRQIALAGFEQARGFIKRELAQRMELRYMPDLKFFYDESIDYGARIEQLLKEAKPEKENDQ